MANLYRIILPVNDIEKAASYYSGVLDLPGIRVSPGRHYFNLGGTILACYDPSADGDPMGEGWKFHESQYIYIATSDLESIYEKVLRNGGTPETKINSMPWGERLFYTRDPFGNPVCFVDETTVFTGE